MDILDLAYTNLTTPMVLAFALGALAALIRSDLRLPDQVYSLLSIYLLLAIGLKGGVELADASFADLWRPLLAALALGLILPLPIYGVTRALGRLTVADAAALAAHYGSVSVVTFTAATTFLVTADIPYEGFMPTLLAVMEVPGIVVALVLANMRTARGGGHLGEALREVVTGRSIVLLLGGLAIGAISGREGIEPVSPLFVDLFRGALTLFLLEMGIAAASRVRDLRRGGVFIVIFGLTTPIVAGTLGVAAGAMAGLSLGGTTLLGVLAASASYIAAPAAVRIALPEANPALYLTASLAVTFPFNLTLGIPLLHQIATVFT
jgi:uncharacterized protein